MPFAPFAKAVAAWLAPSTLPAILSLPPASTTHAARLSPPNVDLQLERSRPRPSAFAREVEQLIVRMAEENRDWGYDRIAGALTNLGYQVCGQTVGNVLHRHG